ncbi:MAG: FecR family protein [bacterium]
MSTNKDIEKWLNHELSDDALSSFLNKEDHKDIAEIDRVLKNLDLSNFNADQSWNSIQNRIQSENKTSNTNSIKIPNWLKIAAVFVIGVLVFQQFYTTDLSYNTALAERLEIALPDNSEVIINADSYIAYSEDNWEKNRKLTLDGEAYFKVAKGESFTVETENGTVTVLGTQFNIKARENFFEVFCYEGSVEVKFINEKTILKAGDSFKVIDGKIIATEKETILNPSWVDHQSRFKSVPFKFVINEFERQHNRKLRLNGIDQNQLFSGTFDNSDLNKGLKAITLPLELEYVINEDNSITISSKK